MRSVHVLLALLLMLATACTPQQQDEPEPPDMPPFGNLASLLDVDQFVFMSDGLPGKRVGDEVVVQPIHGSYVLRDYLQQYDKNPSQDLKEAPQTVGRSAARWMS